MNEVITIDKDVCLLTETGATLSNGIEFYQWKKVGSSLSKASRSLRWWIGDWLNYGVQEYGDTRALAIEHAHLFGLTPEDVRNCMMVSAKVAQRCAGLSWGHHREVMGLSIREQKQWLSKAEREQWSVSELRQALRQDGREIEHTEEVESYGFNPMRAALDFRRWVNQQDLSAWDNERRKLVKQDLKPIVEFWEKL